MISLKRTSLVLAIALVVAGCLLAYYRYGPLRPPSPPQYNTLWISVDALRPDHLGCYGYDRPTSPEIDKLAEKSVVFERAYAQSAFTLPSSYSFLSSLYPSTHRMTLTALPDERSLQYVLNDNLFSIMKNNGRAVRGLLNSWYGQGLDKVIPGVDSASGNADQMNDQARSFIRENRRRPFFLMLHYMEVHAPYVPRPGYIEMFSDELPAKTYTSELIKRVALRKEELSDEELKRMVDVYDNNIRYIDGKAGELIDLLGSLGLDDRTVIIITSDHGEAFMEHRLLGHSIKLYEEFIRIPLIIYVPAGLKIAPRRVGDIVQSIDLMPTLCEFLEMPLPLQAQGSSLAPLMRGSVRENAHAFSEALMTPAYFFGRDNPGPECKFIQAVNTGPWKYIHYVSSGRRELFNLRLDPREGHDILAVEPETAMLMEEKLEQYRALNRAAGGVDIVEQASMTEYQFYQHVRTKLLPETDKTVEQLRSLGYIE
jgi:arylsulfatase A-like enzyme